MSRVLTAQDFVPHIGKIFTPRGQHRALTLVSVESAGRPAGEGMLREPFIVILRGPPGDLLPEALYDVVVENGPDFELYIMPIHTVGRDRQDYQAAFN